MLTRLGGLSASYIYMYCIGFTNDTDLVYWYARHLCSIEGGPSAFGISMFIYSPVFSYIFFYKLTVSNGLSLTTLNSAEITLCSASFEWGGPSAFGISMFIYALVFSYIFL